MRKSSSFFRKSLPLVSFSAAIALEACDFSSDADSTNKNTQDFPINSMSSSELIPSFSSSSEAEADYDQPSKNTAHCFQPWELPYTPDVLTGYGVDTKDAGAWHKFDDERDGGYSYIEWPVELDYPYMNDGDIDPVIEHCDGICGTAHFIKNDDTSNKALYVSTGFYLGGFINSIHNWEDPVPVDASAIGGIVVTYESDNDIYLELGLNEKREVEVDYDVPFAILPKTSTLTTTSLTWQDFKQAGTGTKKITGEEAAQELALFRFKIYGEDGTSADFLIRSVKAYNPPDSNCTNLIF